MSFIFSLTQNCGVAHAASEPARCLCYWRKIETESVIARPPRSVSKSASVVNTVSVVACKPEVQVVVVFSTFGHSSIS
jgi:hypothetical protein